MWHVVLLTVPLTLVLWWQVLVLHVGQANSVITCTVADLEEANTVCTEEMPNMTWKRKEKPNKEHLNSDVWVNLLAAKAVSDKLEGQANKVLLEYWLQLELNQQFWSL